MIIFQVHGNFVKKKNHGNEKQKWGQFTCHWIILFIFSIIFFFFSRLIYKLNKSTKGKMREWHKTNINKIVGINRILTIRLKSFLFGYFVPFMVLFHFGSFIASNLFFFFSFHLILGKYSYIERKLPKVKVKEVKKKQIFSLVIFTHTSKLH